MLDPTTHIGHLRPTAQWMTSHFTEHDQCIVDGRMGSDILSVNLGTEYVVRVINRRSLSLRLHCQQCGYLSWLAVMFPCHVNMVTPCHVGRVVVTHH